MNRPPVWPDPEDDTRGDEPDFQPMAAECCCRLSDSLVHSVTVLAETIRLMVGIDETIAAHGGWPIG